MFLDPSVASSGLNETQLQRKKIPYRVATIYYGLVSRAIAKGGGQGFVKLIVSHDDTMTILGPFTFALRFHNFVNSNSTVL
jgi:pyruvate/2-oxoglutarate dehydrogenase complex dihydrolipoamide dehydrogenase (E3) component